jgi:tetratricopeptide (TPR) repeat protein
MNHRRVIQKETANRSQTSARVVCSVGRTVQETARAIKTALPACCVVTFLTSALTLGADADPNRISKGRNAASGAAVQNHELNSRSILGDSLRLKLWQSRILPPDPNEDAETRSALADLIRRVEAATLERPESKPVAPAAATVEPRAATSVSVAPPQTIAAERPTTAPQSPIEQNTALDAETLKRLSHLVEDPNQVSNPLEIAELLFLSGRPAEAAVFYERALALTVPNDPATSDDRAWILFQLGTSLRETDISRARDTYMKLITEFPNSPWTELAKANGRLLSWYQSTKPQQLISSAGL